MARLAVPQVADWCTIVLLAEDGSIQTVAVANEDPERVAWARELLERNPSDPSSRRGVAAVISTGRPELVPEITDELLVEAMRDRPGLLEPLRSLGLRSWLIVPLVAREPGRRRAVARHVRGVRAASGRERRRPRQSSSRGGRRRRSTTPGSSSRPSSSERVLERQGEASIDGLLVVGADASILSINERFREIWQIPDEAIAQGDDAALEAAMERVEDPDAFIARVREVYARREVTREELRFRDGRTIERYGSPVTGRRRLVPRLPVVVPGHQRPERGRAGARGGRARASQALEFVGDGVFLIDATGVVRRSGTRRPTRITGLEEADVLGEPAAEALAGWPLDGGSASARDTFPIELDGRELLAVALGRALPGGHGGTPSAT